MLHLYVLCRQSVRGFMVYGSVGAFVPCIVFFLGQSDLVRLLRAELLASQGKEVENLLGLCDQFLARHDSLRDSSFEEKRGR